MEAELVDFLKEAKEKSSITPVALSVRELLAKWSAKRRGYWIVERVRADLDAFALTTDPDFNDVWIDADVKIVPVEQDAESNEPTTTQETSTTSPIQREIYLRVNSLASANSGLVSVVPQDTVQTAQALMMRYDYSQLPVLSGERDLRGAVSWESIAQARIRNSECSLADATGSAELVRGDDDLLAQIPRIVSSGFVFVQALDKRVVGIVTTADLSEAFARTANPFFMLGEIERQLRDIIDRHFSAEELAAVVDPGDEQRSVDNADQLTFGEYVRLLENPGNWGRPGWDLDRKIFIAALDDIRQIRNDVMHFSPDPLETADIKKLKDFAQWLRKLRPRIKTT
jgi:CBS domain-containing protein